MRGKLRKVHDIYSNVTWWGQMDEGEEKKGSPGWGKSWDRVGTDWNRLEPPMQ